MNHRKKLKQNKKVKPDSKVLDAPIDCGIQVLSNNLSSPTKNNCNISVEDSTSSFMDNLSGISELVSSAGDSIMNAGKSVVDYMPTDTLADIGKGAVDVAGAVGQGALDATAAVGKGAIEVIGGLADGL